MSKIFKFEELKNVIDNDKDCFNIDLKVKNYVVFKQIFTYYKISINNKQKDENYISPLFYINKFNMKQTPHIHDNNIKYVKVRISDNDDLFELLEEQYEKLVNKLKNNKENKEDKENHDDYNVIIEPLHNPYNGNIYYNIKLPVNQKLPDKPIKKYEHSLIVDAEQSKETGSMIYEDVKLDNLIEHIHNGVRANGLFKMFVHKVIDNNKKTITFKPNLEFTQLNIYKSEEKEPENSNQSMDSIL